MFLPVVCIDFQVVINSLRENNNFINYSMQNLIMPEDLIERVEADINNYNSLEDLRQKFIKDGYLEKDIDEAIFRITRKSKGSLKLSRAVKAS